MSNVNIKRVKKKEPGVELIYRKHIEELLHLFENTNYAGDQKQLTQDINNAMEGSQPATALWVGCFHKAMHQTGNPIVAVAAAFNAGIVIGMLMERKLKTNAN